MTTSRYSSEAWFCLRCCMMRSREGKRRWHSATAHMKSGVLRVVRLTWRGREMAGSLGGIGDAGEAGLELIWCGGRCDGVSSV